MTSETFYNPWSQNKKNFEVEMTPILNNTIPSRVVPMPNQSLYAFYPPLNVPQTVPPNPFLPQSAVLQSPAVPVQPLGVNMTNYSGPPPMYNVATSNVSRPFQNFSSSSASIPKIYPTLQPKLENSEPIQSQQKSPDKVIQESNKKENSKKPVKVNETAPKVEQKIERLEQNITKRCLRCYQYYTEASIERDENKTPCRFHPGNYMRGYSSPLLSGAAITYWSCCKSSNKNEPGCRQSQHKEDPQMTKIQQNFSRNVEEQTKIGLLIDAPFTLGVEKDKEEEKEKEKKK